MRIFTTILAFFSCTLIADDKNTNTHEKLMYLDNLPIYTGEHDIKPTFHPIITGMDYQGNYYSMQKQPDGTWKSWNHSKKKLTEEEVKEFKERINKND